jgi:hypothetical protein
LLPNDHTFSSPTLQTASTLSLTISIVMRMLLQQARKPPWLTKRG